MIVGILKLPTETRLHIYQYLLQDLVNDGKIDIEAKITKKRQSIFAWIQAQDQQLSPGEVILSRCGSL